MNIYIIIAIYWACAVGITYYVRFLNSKKRRLIPFQDKESFWERVVVFLSIVCLVPLCSPFILVYLLYKWMDKTIYKNGPRPVDKRKSQYFKKDTVLDANMTTMSLSEYNYKYNKSYTLYDIYGKGYTDSLSKEELDDIKKNEYGIITIQEEIPEDQYTSFAKNLGQALIDGNFNTICNCFDLHSELILYGSKTIKSNENIIEYWKGWREKYVLTRKVKKLTVQYNNYYSHACLKIDHMLVLFSLSDDIVSIMMLSPVSLHPYVGYHDNLMDFPFSIDEIKTMLTKQTDGNETVESINRNHRIPCFQCGSKSENLEWHDFKKETGEIGYSGQVTICPKCNRVVEFYPNKRYRFSPREITEEELPF